MPQAQPPKTTLFGGVTEPGLRAVMPQAQPPKPTLFGGVTEPGLRAASAALIKLVDADLNSVVGAGGAIPFTCREPGRDRRIRCDDARGVTRRGLHIHRAVGSVADSAHEVCKLERNALSRGERLI